MKPARRWLQYSLRSFLILLTAIAVWLGVVVQRANEQREAVEAIQTLGGRVIYDWQSRLEEWPSGGQVLVNTGQQPNGPTWLGQLFGNELFQKVHSVVFLPSIESPNRYHVPTNSEIRSAIPHLKRLRQLKKVWYWEPESDELHREMITALPNTKVLKIGPAF